MTTSKAKDDEKLPIQHDRSFFYLKEMGPFGYSVDALLDLGVSQKLTLSFVLASRSVISGDYLDEEGDVECPQADNVFSGLAPIIPEYLWQILADDAATIEYTHKSETNFARIEHSMTAPLPTVTREQVLITKRDWQRFIDGKSPSPIAIPEISYKTKKSETLIIGALAYLYGTTKGKINPAYLNSGKSETGGVVIQSVTNDVVDLLSSSETHHPSAGVSNVQAQISQGLKTVGPVVNQSS